MTACCRHLQYDVIDEFGFDQSFELQTEMDNYFLLDAVTTITHKASVYVQCPKLQYLQLDKLLYRKGLWMREKYLKLMGRLLKASFDKEAFPQRSLFLSC